MASYDVASNICQGLPSRSASTSAKGQHSSLTEASPTSSSLIAYRYTYDSRARTAAAAATPQKQGLTSTLVNFSAQFETFLITAPLTPPVVSLKRCSRCTEKWTSGSPCPGVRQSHRPPTAAAAAAAAAAVRTQSRE